MIGPGQSVERIRQEIPEPDNSIEIKMARKVLFDLVYNHLQGGRWASMRCRESNMFWNGKFDSGSFKQFTRKVMVTQNNTWEAGYLIWLAYTLVVKGRVLYKVFSGSFLNKCYYVSYLLWPPNLGTVCELWSDWWKIELDLCIHCFTFERPMRYHGKEMSMKLEIEGQSLEKLDLVHDW